MSKISITNTNNVSFIMHGHTAIVKILKIGKNIYVYS